MDIYINVDKDGWTKGFQLNIGDDNGGFRLAGPEYNGSSKSIIHHKIDERDAAEIRSYLDKAFPSDGKGLPGMLKAASSALRSYQYGNSSPDLAKEISDMIDLKLK